MIYFVKFTIAKLEQQFRSIPFKSFVCIEQRRKQKRKKNETLTLTNIHKNRMHDPLAHEPWTKHFNETDNSK